MGVETGKGRERANAEGRASGPITMPTGGAAEYDPPSLSSHVVFLPVLNCFGTRRKAQCGCISRFGLTLSRLGDSA